MQDIRVECDGEFLVQIDELTDLQGGLKRRTKDDIAKIKKSILTYGVSFPFFVWIHEGKKYCLDGQGRIAALKAMRADGHELPDFPSCEVKAKDRDEAVNKLLRLNSQYGVMTVDSVLEFSEWLDIEFKDLLLSVGKDLVFECEIAPIYCDVIRRRWTKYAKDPGFGHGTGALE